MKQLLKNREAQLALVILSLLAMIGAIIPDFLAISNLLGVYTDTSILIILALGQMLVIITRCIDLSIAANVALTGMVVATINSLYPDFPVPVIILIGAGFGTLLGMLNGWLVWKMKIPSIVVTLGTMAIFRGAVFLISKGAWINAHQMSATFLEIPRYVFLGLPILGWCSVIVIAAMYYFTRHRQLGRKIYAAGNSPTAAYYIGVDVGKKQFIAFTISGLLAGIASYLWISRYAVAYVDIANGFEMLVIASCVIGGVSIAGGTGTVIGCVLGALFLGIINNALPVIGISPFWQMAISGSVIILAVIANSRSERKVGRIILRKAVQNAS
ncbi:ABC transporter permease [Alginatibacterium sediminis]|uniref:ABC transporter permease n=1 Tax=Alginatibacterium sediminis TaxID=2164068 RepID=A0A420EB14_9ALTE|nr:ABC transporter permease [Alginatibacterium sediminis]RKF17870.1 ABC transporter permease [Alginatibacterium sediminis]